MSSCPMKSVKLLFVLLISFILSSCSSTYHAYPTERDPEVFKGMTHKQIVMSYGAPTQTTPDGEGGYILVYEGNKSLFIYNDYYARGARQLPTVQFFMSSEGVCLEARYYYEQSVRQYDPQGTAALFFLLR